MVQWSLRNKRCHQFQNVSEIAYWDNHTKQKGPSNYI